jgi:hypothetical protein
MAISLFSLHPTQFGGARFPHVHSIFQKWRGPVEIEFYAAAFWDRGHYTRFGARTQQIPPRVIEFFVSQFPQQAGTLIQNAFPSTGLAAHRNVGKGEHG